MGRNMVHIVEENIIKTYPEKWRKRSYQFREVIKLRKETGWSKYKISEYLKISIGRVKHWIYDKTEPFPIKVIRDLENRGLLPFSENNKHFELILDCFAFMFGDGTLTCNSVGFSGKKEDLKLIKEKLSKIGFKGKIITKKLSNYKILNERILNGTTNDLRINSSSLARLLISLGAPIGDKTIKPIIFPEWLKKSNDNTKRRFLSVLYGCEGRIPRSKDKTIHLGLKLSKNISYKKAHEQFLDDIRKVLLEFGIRTSPLDWSKKINKRKDGIHTQACRFVIVDYVSILRFFNNIKILYNESKTKEFHKTIFKILKKLQKHISIHEKYDKCCNMYPRMSICEISKKLNLNYQTLQYWINEGEPLLYNKGEEIEKETEKLRSSFPAL